MSVGQCTRERLGPVLFYGIVVVVAYFVFLVFQPFLTALAWAVVIVVVSYPLYLRLLARRFSPSAAAAICTVGVTLILIVPTLLVMAAFVRQGVQAVQNLQGQIEGGHFN